MKGVYLVVGRMGSGKTVLMKHIMNSVKTEKYAFSIIKNDYDELVQYQNFEKFVSMMDTKTNTIFVIDEAYTILPDKLNVDKNPKHRQLAKILVNSRKLNNLIFIVFHQLKQVKTWLPAYTTFMLRFNTNDQLRYQIPRFDSYRGVQYSLLHKPTFEPFVYSDKCKVPKQNIHFHLISFD